MPKYLNGRNATLGNTCTSDFEGYRADSLSEAQSTYFLTITWGQVANIFVRKTFTESIFSVHRLTNNPQVLGSVVFELCLVFCLIYIPGLNDIFLLKGISAEYVFITIWYIPVLIFYDEVRKWFVRKWPTGCCAMVTTF
jgi:sodium/potassium-transporting ATPase subunit alpha